MILKLDHLFCYETLISIAPFVKKLPNTLILKRICYSVTNDSIEEEDLVLGFELIADSLKNNEKVLESMLKAFLLFPQSWKEQLACQGIFLIESLMVTLRKNVWRCWANPR